MELHFLGRGNSSNAKEGNTSAYFIENQELFLIDCGETVFSKMMKLELLNDIKEIHVLITHTHSDHIGSLGSLIMYCYFNKKIKLNIILPTTAKHKNSIITILQCMGCNNKMYEIKEEEYYKDKYQSFQSIKYLETKHVDYLDCYGIQFETKEGILYYSGDTREINNIQKIINENNQIDKIYVDVTSTNIKDNIHLYIKDLEENIPKELKNKVYCMHFNNEDCIKKAISIGFHVVKVEQKNNR